MAMELKHKNYIMSYLSDAFIQSLDLFEDIIQQCSHEISKDNDFEFCSLPEEDLQKMQVSALAEGSNKKCATEVIVLRILWTRLYTFMLVTESIPSYKCSQFHCVMVETFDIQGPFFEGWKKGLGLSIRLFLKEPIVDSDINDMVVLRVLMENVMCRKDERWKANPEEIKLQGNEKFKQKEYLSAFLNYEFAMAMCHEYCDSKTRAILYSNSAACLYEMNLFESSLKYSNIAIRINHNYEKGYTRKINSLLEKKAFGEIPTLLMILQSKSCNEFLTKINRKYSVYLANSLGMYNWKEIIQIHKNPDVCVCEYFSKYIGRRMEGDRYVYYALEDLKPYQLLIISKPIIYQNNTSDSKQLDYLFQRVYKCISLQKSFFAAVQNLPCPCHPNGGSNSHNEYFMESKEVEKKLDRTLVFPKDILSREKSSLSIGVWGELFKMTQNCNPNCSFIHFKNIMVVSTTRKIAKGSSFTIDLTSDAEVLKRKSVLENKYGIKCECEICEWKKWPSDLSNNHEVAEVLKSLTNLRMKKQLYWNMIKKKKIFQVKFKKEFIFRDILRNYLELVKEQIHWEDLLNVIKLLRDDNSEDNEKILKETFCLAFMKLLKIPQENAAVMLNEMI